ncbi:uncharacterized protein LOC143240269 isoform X1 [Tachypleus tridentatus]|uniref:uncharacterized protein LOC143240269 isoform X1 n=1 Tax=Tachypleus tridentatus TaxID=6853 RepID=UPI003FD34299
MKNLMTVSVILCVVVGTAVAHVALTFPPARKYNLDFLDNGRTKAPCGMPKGDIATSLPAGAKIVITWHLAYPHKGGFKLEVLDKNERHLLDLTPTTPESDFVGANDTTAQSYTVHFPQSLSCSGCSIRLLRQAKEWASNYLFWSCADVDIVPVTEFDTVCSGSGKLVNGLCACNRLNLGNLCQYKDECWSDEDCGSHGKCIDVKATTYPKMQCFCQPGWFGEKCTKKSSVTAPLDLSYYNSKDLSDKYMLYWRILEETEEIEAVLQAESTSYVAVGWRPQGITSNCKAFPVIESRRSNLRFLETDVIKIQKVGENKLKEDSDKGKLKPTAKGKPEPSSESTLVSEILHPFTEETSESDFENMRSNHEENIIYLTSSSAPATEDSKTAVVGVPLGVGPSDGLERKLFVNNNRFPRQAVLPLQPASGNNSEPRAEPKSKPGTQQDNHGHSESEPGTLVGPEPTNFQDLGQTSTTNAGSKRKPLHLYPSPTSYTPKFELHSMDCSDIVIGTVRGNLSRVFDYYTRDRSTPRVDSYYGGSDTLTAAVGFEKDGKTTVLFRKKIKAEELTDHTIENAEMNIIWALGQEPGNYIHRPATGLETGNAKVKDFYRYDEIKYHGHGQQRGIATLNFYEERKVKNEVQEPAEKRIEGCAGEWKHPSDCEDDSCEYIARWYFHETKDEIYFWISSSHLDKWTGIGFSKDEDMANSDAVIGWISSDGKVSIFDSWLTGYSHPEYDIKQNTYNATGKLENGLMTLQFIRKRNTGDTDQDISFSDNECLYFMFPVKGGQYNNAFKQISAHDVTPFVSLVCIQSCPVPVLNRNKKPKIEPEPNSEPEPSGEHEPNTKPQEESVVQCMGEWKSPTDCRGYGCDYRAVWEYIDKSDEISFTISTKNHNKWTGIAFSKDRKMEATDAILGWVEENGRFFIMDTWLADYKQPSLDSSQSISNMSGWREDGITTLKFVRKRHTGDLERDLHFTDTECLYMFFPVHGGVFNAVNKKIRQHESTPKISENKICIKSCTQKQEVILAATASTSTPVPKLTSKVPKIRRPVLHFPTFRTPSTPFQQATTLSTSTTPSPPPPPTTTTLMTSQSHTSPPVMLVTTLPTPQKMEYIIEVKLPQHGNLNLKEKDSEEYRNLQKQILKDMSVVLTSLDGFEGVEVTELSSIKGDESIIAQMNVIIVDKHLQKKDREGDRSIYHMEELSKTLNETIKEGYIGTLLVDPAYLIIQPAGRVQQTSPNEIDTKQGSKDPDFPEHDTEVYIIIGGIGALVLLIVIQASCMIYRNRRNQQQSHTKEQLINSQWKDYATASSTYSYENFAMREEDRHVSKHPVGSVSNGSAVSRKSAPSHPSANGKSNGRSRHSRPLPPAGHSHTLERISSRHSDGFSNMSGYSSAYATHDRSLRSASSTLRAQQELQPDFYFMPHQRRYSGEVVRVYVDYNNPEYSGK